METTAKVLIGIAVIGGIGLGGTILYYKKKSKISNAIRVFLSQNKGIGLSLIHRTNQTTIEATDKTKVIIDRGDKLLGRVNQSGVFEPLELHKKDGTKHQIKGGYYQAEYNTTLKDIKQL